MLTRLPSCERIVVIGDIHGDYQLCINILTMAKIISMETGTPQWVANPPSTIVVQIGDQIDSCRPTPYSPCGVAPAGTPTDLSNNLSNDLSNDLSNNLDKPDDIKVLNFFTRLHTLAEQKGGKVVSLLGNHEILNSLGDMRYVSYQNLQAFQHNTSLNPSRIQDGKEARIDAFKPGNPLALDMATTRQSAIIVGNNLFVHAGILPNVAKKYTIDVLNYTIQQWLLGKISTTSIAPLLKSSIDSPFWPRHYGNIKSDIYNRSHRSTQSNDEICMSLLDPVLKQYNVKRMIVGHTPQSFQQMQGINSACNEKLWRVDTGSSTMFDKFTTLAHTEHRKAQYLEIINDTILTVYVERMCR